MVLISVLHVRLLENYMPSFLTPESHILRTLMTLDRIAEMHLNHAHLFLVQTTPIS